MDQITKLLLETARRLFTGGCEPDAQKAAERGEFQSRLWRDIEDNGLTQALVPESLGGVGLGLEEACAVLRVAGAFALPLPLADTMLGACTLAQSGITVPTGTLTVACLESETTDFRSASPEGLSGKAINVPWLPAVDNVVLVAPRLEGSRVLLLSRERLAAAIVSAKDPAGDPIGDLDLSLLPEGVLESAFLDSSADNTSCERGSELQGAESRPCALSANDVFRTAALMRVCLTAGALDRVLDLCIEHATERIQFGRPVAKFQAVQNLVAIVAGETAAVGVGAPSAVRAWQEDRDRLAVACAKARACEAAGKVARIAHQVHAAIGYTQEHILHRFTRRLWSWRDQYGDEAYWSLVVGSSIQDAGGDAIWKELTQFG